MFVHKLFSQIVAYGTLTMYVHSIHDYIFYKLNGFVKLITNIKSDEIGD